MRYRVLIDTNVFVSFLIGKAIKDLPKLIYSEAVVLVVSDELISEFIEVASRPKFIKYFSREVVENALLLLSEKSISVEPTSKVNVCRDPKDNYLLSIAEEGNVDLLVSGDDDLLTLGSYKNTRIVPFKEFEQLFNQ